MSERASVAVVGGGIVGTALAWQLAERGVPGVVVVDLDLAGIYASSELNAGGARATWWQRVNVETCRATLDLFREEASRLGFREHGYLWLYDDDGLLEQARRFRSLQNEQGLGVELLEAGEVAERFPILDRNLDELRGATFSPRDGLVNPNAVRQHYRERAEAAGARFLDRAYVVGVRTALETGPAGPRRRVTAIEALQLGRIDPTDEAGRLRDILTRHRAPAELVEGELALETEVVVNCLGAWSPLLSARLGVPDVTRPVRRQIALVDVHAQDRAPGVDFATLGMIVDPSGLYYHPEGPHVLAGFSIPDEPAGYDFDYDGDDFFLQQIWPRLAHRASSFERCGHVRGWAGLYAATPDRSGIAGAVPGYANLFEAHSFTGRGVMQSYGIARDMAALIATGRFEQVDLSPLARDRFADRSRWVMEDLHI